MASIEPTWNADTIVKLYRQGTISLDTQGWNEKCDAAIEGINLCRHEHSPITHVIRRCLECERTITSEVPTGKLFTQVRQGIISVEGAIEVGGLDIDTKAALRAIPVCLHAEVASRSYRCRDGKPRKVCVDCGRTWSVSDDS